MVNPVHQNMKNRLLSSFVQYLLYTVNYCNPIPYFLPVICLLPYFYSIICTMVLRPLITFSIILSNLSNWATCFLSGPRTLEYPIFMPSHCWTEQKITSETNYFILIWFVSNTYWLLCIFLVSSRHLEIVIEIVLNYPFLYFLKIESETTGVSFSDPFRTHSLRAFFKKKKNI